MSNSSQSTRPTGRVLWEALLTYYVLMFCIAYSIKGQVHMFAGQVKIVSPETVTSLKSNGPC